METPRDITYCDNNQCQRWCERNTKYHDFRNQIISISMFNTVKDWTEENCEYFMDLDLNHLPTKLIDFIIDKKK